MINEDLFVLVNGVPELSIEAKLIKPYNTLIKRDKGSEGDADGRKKLLATKEIAFVVWYSNLKSVYNRNYEPSARIAELKKGLKLPDDWKIDDCIRDAMKEYAKTQVTPSSVMLTSTRNAIYEARNLIEILDTRLKALMKKVKETMLLENVTDDYEKELDALIIRAMTYIESLLKYSKQITDMLSTLDTLEKKYVKEMEESRGKNKIEVSKHQL
jgi:hypothetical protein